VKNECALERFFFFWKNGYPCFFFQKQWIVPTKDVWTRAMNRVFVSITL
jgi:hypothetical protein